jgi:hypothetical protein
MGHTHSIRVAWRAGKQNLDDSGNSDPVSNSVARSTPLILIIMTLFRNMSIECHL